MFFPKKNKIVSPVNGEYLPLSEVNDSVFAQGMMGEGVAVVPSSNEILSPVEGKISMVSEQKHGIGISMKNGAEILIHMGIDTVELKGTPFEVKVKEGDMVKEGDLLALMDIQAIQNAGKETTIMIISTNTPLKKITLAHRQLVNSLDELAEF